MLGPRGTGKTQFAVELGLRLATCEVLAPPHGRRISQKYRVLGELFAEEKASWRSDDKDACGPLRRTADDALLVLDEIQERTESSWEDTELTMLFDRRYQDMQRTVLIANLDLAGFRAKMPGSIYSRIVETGLVVECDWPSFRGAR